MLRKICIKNIALIEELEIEFDKGLNVLTGETGAGKSIIIDSLNFVLGARTDKSLIRSGESIARVDALFDICNNEVLDILSQFDIDAENELLISRSMNIDNRSDVKVNGRSVTVSMLKEITSHLVDIYGQQEQVTLMQPKMQLSLVDNFGGDIIKTLIADYQSKLSNLKQVKAELNSFTSLYDNVDREKDYLTFVIDEISSANLTETEEEELLQLKQRLSNYEKIISATTTLQNHLSNGLSSVSQGVSNINGVVSYDDALENLKDRLESVKIELDDIVSEVNQYNQNADYDERELKNV